MTRLQAIQLQGTVLQPIDKITNDARTAVSKICVGIDDMKLLGNKALVFRAEIYPKRLKTLFADLASIGIKLSRQGLPDIESLQEKMEYPLSIHIVSFSDDTDRLVNVPKVPG